MKRFARRNRSLFNTLLIVFVLGGLFPSVALSAPPVLSKVEGPQPAIELARPEEVAAPYLESVADPSPKSQVRPGLPSRAKADVGYLRLTTAVGEFTLLLLGVVATEGVQWDDLSLACSLVFRISWEVS